jgi:nucleoside-diphosphate-sugar epimerase
MTYYGIKSTVLRLFNVYGRGGTGIINIFVNRGLKGEPISLYGEEQLRDFIHVDDVAETFNKIMSSKKCFNETINVGTGVGRSIRDIAEIVREYLPDMDIERKDFEGELYDSVADISKLKELIDFEPDGSVERIKRTIEEMI